MKKETRKKYIFSSEKLRKDLLAESRALRIHVGFAEIITEKCTKSVEKYLETHPVVTEADIEKIVYTELKKYHKDLAYIYHNRDKII